MALLGAPVRGMYRGELLSLCSRERSALIQGSLSSPLKSGGFFGTFGCNGKGYLRRELLSLRSREREVVIKGSLCSRERSALIQGSLCSPLKSGGFFGTFGCTGKGYVGRDLREGGSY